MTTLHRSALDEEKKKNGKLSDVLNQQQQHNEQYIEELEAERLRNVQYKDRSGQVIEVSLCTQMLKISKRWHV